VYTEKEPHGSKICEKRSVFIFNIVVMTDEIMLYAGLLLLGLSAASISTKT
jgi:hypothetical protein